MSIRPVAGGRSRPFRAWPRLHCTFKMAIQAWPDRLEGLAGAISCWFKSSLAHQCFENPAFRAAGFCFVTVAGSGRRGAVAGTLPPRILRFGRLLAVCTILKYSAVRWGACDQPCRESGAGRCCGGRLGASRARMAGASAERATRGPGWAAGSVPAAATCRPRLLPQSALKRTNGKIRRWGRNTPTLGLVVEGDR
jgi:hypothetical protein